MNVQRFLKHEGAFVAAFSLLWFTLLQPWGGYLDPDAFYHAHISRLMLDQGPIYAFPWLDLTTLGTHFVDHHYFFHLILGPAIFAFGEFWGTSLMAPILATLTCMGLWTLLKRIGLHHAWLLVFLTIFIPNFTLRMSLGKASPLAVGFFLAIVGSYVFRKPTIAFFAATLFALSHGGWMIVIVAIGLMAFADLLFLKSFSEPRWRNAIPSVGWKTIGAMLAGIIFGLVLHPNRGELIPFLWIQLVKVALPTTGAYIQGSEWRPPDLSALGSSMAPLLIAFLAGMLGLMTSVKRNISVENMRMAILFAMPVALTFAATLMSYRMVEYLAPAFALWIGSLWIMIDGKRFVAELRETFQSLKRPIRTIAFPAIALLGIALLFHHAAATWESTHKTPHPYDSFNETFGAISAVAEPGDRVFHSNWDEFPILFARDDKLRYVSGLDPTFLYESDPELSNAVYQVTLGMSTTSHYELIRERTGSRFVFITLPRHKRFDETLESDQRFKELARDDISVAYEVLK